MKTLIKKKLRESLENRIEYRVEHLGSVYGQDNYELGAYVNDDIIGMVQYVIFNGVLTISNIVVRPEYRRLGYGSKMMQYLKTYHPDATYKASFKTDDGMKFQHKQHDDVESLVEHLDLDDEFWDQAVIEIIKPLAYMMDKYYYQALPVSNLQSDKVSINKGGTSVMLSIRNIKVLKIFKYRQKEEMETYLKELRSGL